MQRGTSSLGRYSGFKRALHSFINFLQHGSHCLVASSIGITALYVSYRQDTLTNDIFSLRASVCCNALSQIDVALGQSIACMTPAYHELVNFITVSNKLPKGRQFQQELSCSFFFLRKEIYL